MKRLNGQCYGCSVQLHAQMQWAVPFVCTGSSIKYYCTFCFHAGPGCHLTPGLPTIVKMTDLQMRIFKIQMLDRICRALHQSAILVLQLVFDQLLLDSPKVLWTTCFV